MYTLLACERERRLRVHTQTRERERQGERRDVRTEKDAWVVVVVVVASHVWDRTRGQVKRGRRGEYLGAGYSLSDGRAEGGNG